MYIIGNQCLLKMYQNFPMPRLITNNNIHIVWGSLSSTTQLSNFHNRTHSFIHCKCGDM